MIRFPSAAKGSSYIIQVPQTAAYKSSAEKYRFNACEQISSGIGLKNVAQSARAKGMSDHIRI
jgi:hypothetical protein